MKCTMRTYLYDDIPLLVMYMILFCIDSFLLRFQVLNLAFGSDSHFFRLQRGAVVTAVGKCIDTMTQQITAEIRRQQEKPIVDDVSDEMAKVVVVGDGQYDSPGNCAKCCTYSVALYGVEQPDGDGNWILQKSG